MWQLATSWSSLARDITSSAIRSPVRSLRPARWLHSTELKTFWVFAQGSAGVQSEPCAAAQSVPQLKPSWILPIGKPIENGNAHPV